MNRTDLYTDDVIREQILLVVKSGADLLVKLRDKIASIYGRYITKQNTAISKHFTKPSVYTR